MKLHWNRGRTTQDKLDILLDWADVHDAQLAVALRAASPVPAPDPVPAETREAAIERLRTKQRRAVAAEAEAQCLHPDKHRLAGGVDWWCRGCGALWTEAYLYRPSASTAAPTPKTTGHDA